MNVCMCVCIFVIETWSCSSVISIPMTLPCGPTCTNDTSLSRLEECVREKGEGSTSSLGHIPVSLQRSNPGIFRREVPMLA